MSIQVGSSVHAAVTMFSVKPEDEGPPKFLQSPQGCILQRLYEAESDANAWLFLLDYGLDVGSTAFSCTSFGALEPPTANNVQPATPLLFHIDDRVKLLVMVAEVDGELRAVSQSFHALFLNFQANQQELYPVDLGNLPGGLG